MGSHFKSGLWSLDQSIDLRRRIKWTDPLLIVNDTNKNKYVCLSMYLRYVQDQFVKEKKG